MRDCYAVKAAPAFSVCCPDAPGPVVTWVDCPSGVDFASAPAPYDDAFGVMIRQRDSEVRTIIVDGRRVTPGPMSKGTTSIFDLKMCRYTTRISPFSFIHFNFPRHYLNAIAEQEGRKRLYQMELDEGLRIEDPIFAALGDLMEAVFTNVERATTFLIDDVSVATVSLVVDRYCAPGGEARAHPPRLTSEQMRRSVDILDANLSGGLTLTKVAAECNLPPARFRRAFKESFGASPSAWLERRRLDLAVRLLRDRSIEYTSVARTAGFANRRQMDQVFSKFLGQPAPWFRTSVLGGPGSDAPVHDLQVAQTDRLRLN